MSPSRLPNDAVCIYSHSSVETTKSASVRMQFGYVIPIPANSCQCAKSVERRYTLVMHGVCEMSSSLHTITLSTRLSPTGHRGQLINLTCRVFHGNCEECISAFKCFSSTLFPVDKSIVCCHHHVWPCGCAVVFRFRMISWKLLAGLFPYCTHTSLKGCRCAFWGFLMLIEISYFTQAVHVFICFIWFYVV